MKCILARLMVVLFVVLLPLSGMARTTTALWYDKLPEGMAFETPPFTSKDQARLGAFADVVMEEAKVLLHADVPEERLVYLHDFLTPRAAQFVVSYTELGVADAGQARQLTVDVQVNRDLLRQQLQRLGLFTTLHAPLVYSPQYGTVEPKTWEELGRLHVLYGLTPNSDAPLALRMNLQDKVWTVSLRDTQNAAAAPLFASADTLEVAWGKVWGAYFSAESKGAQPVSATVLSIDGWFTPDGVEAFDTMLQEWSDILGMVSLQNVTMEAAGIRGNWSVQVLDADTLRARLTEYTSKRRLSFSLQDK